MLFYLLFFGLLYRYFRRYKSPVLNFILLFYVAASICGLLTHYFVEPDAYSTVLSVPFHLFCLYLFICPFIAYGKHEREREYILMDERRYKTLSWVLIILQIFSVLFFAADDIRLLIDGNFASARNEALYGDIESNKSFFRTVAGVASYYYCFNILLFFYSLAFRKDSKKFLFLLIGSSLSRVFHSLNYVGRDGILFWILSFLFSYFLFSRYLEYDAKKITKRIFLIFGSFAIVIMVLISISRFGESDSGTFNSMISYFGKPLNNFGRLFDRYHEHNGGLKAFFPLLFGERGGSGAASIANAESFYLRYGFYSNTFFTFIGNFYRAWGPFITLIVSLFYGGYMTQRLNRKIITMPTLIVLMFASQIILHNYFYWAYSIRVANLFIFSLPLFIYYCRKRQKY